MAEQEPNGIPEQQNDEEPSESILQTGSHESESLLLSSLRARQLDFESEVQRLQETGEAESFNSFLEQVNEHQDNLVLNAGHSNELNALAGGMLLQKDLHLVTSNQYADPAPFAVITSRNLLERLININAPKTDPEEERLLVDRERHAIANTVLGILAEEAGQRDLVSSLSQIEEMSQIPAYRELFESQLLEIKRSIYQCQATEIFLSYYDATAKFETLPSLAQKTEEQHDQYQKLQNALNTSKHREAQELLFEKNL